MDCYDTVTKAVSGLRDRGFSEDFNLKETYLEVASSKKQLSPKDFEIVEFYRFEGDSDPGDMNIVYAIESRDGMKGILIDAFGTYSDPVSQELVKKLNVHKDKEKGL